MDTPIRDFISSYVSSDSVRLHMPGHKGCADIDFASFDITEVKGTEGLIEKSEKNASEIFGCPTYYSAEGSSLAIRAMCNIVTGMDGKRLILASRNCHQTFITACALLDIDVEWLVDKDSDLISSPISPGFLEEEILKYEPSCVYITSPDYIGFMSDIRSIARVCHRHGVLLAVDNAHGAYLKFFSSHPMDLGADICCDSAHKTLPVLTGGAYLHLTSELDGKTDVKRAMSLFSSTSPSWLILSSLDNANRIMADPKFIADLKKTYDRVGQLCPDLPKYGNEYLKLTLCPLSKGYSGVELGDILRQKGIEPEFCDRDFVTLMFSPYNTDEDFERLSGALSVLPVKAALPEERVRLPRPVKRRSIRSALLGKTEVIPVEKAQGRICAFSKTSCPPAIPVVLAGEEILREHIEALRYYGFDSIEVCCDFE